MLCKNNLARYLPVVVLATCVTLCAQNKPLAELRLSGRLGNDIPSADGPSAIISGWSQSGEAEPQPVSKDGLIVLEPGRQDVTIFYRSLQPTITGLEFRYRLSGYDSDWTTTLSQLAHYRKLPPDRYVFEVQAHSRGLPWPASSASIVVQRKPFFYETWYAYVIGSVGLFVLASLLLEQHDQLLKGRIGIVLEERNRIANDFHDSLMAGFAAISWQLEATAKLLPENESDTSAVDSCALARLMVTHCQAEARRIIWDLRDSVELTHRVSSALTQAIDVHPSHDQIPIDFTVTGAEIDVEPAAVHQFVCLVQEALNNVLRHAKASIIHIQLHYDDESLTLRIEDNGKGFDVSRQSIPTGHFGIAVMEERARKLGGTFRISSSPEIGTEVIVSAGFEEIRALSKIDQQVLPWIGI
jgi:signal transduction histidine kinase